MVIYGGTTEEGLTIIRMEIDPCGLTVSRGEWVTIDHAIGQRIH